MSDIDIKIDITYLDTVAAYFKAYTDLVTSHPDAPQELKIAGQAAFMDCMKELDKTYKNAGVVNV